MIAVDWSGRASGARRYIWAAEAHDGRLVRLESGRTRAELVEHLVSRAGEDPAPVVGFDFSFSLPEWFLDERGFATADALWEAAERDGEAWLRACESPFWGRPGHARPELVAHLRATEAELAAVGGIRPKSTFQIGGAGSVGTGSVRGFPILRQLRASGFAVWPFHAPARRPLAVEIYPRALTGPVVKSSAPARVAYLEAQFPELNPAMRDVAASTEDAFDAAVSAIVMSRHEHELLALPTCDDARTRREGRVWLPGQAASVLEPAERGVDERLQDVGQRRRAGEVGEGVDCTTDPYGGIAEPELHV